MSILDKLKDKAEDVMSEIKDKTEDIVYEIKDRTGGVVSEIKDKAEDVVSDCVLYLGDKAEEVIDLADRRMQKGFKKLDEKEETFNAIFGLEEYKGSSMRDRAKVVFAKKAPGIRASAEYGDILCVDRGLYLHFGIYIGNDRVIHYSGENADFDFRNIKSSTIREDSLSRFIHNNSEYFVFDCGSDENKEFFSDSMLMVYTPEETVERAKSKLGENQYNLPFNNCEHFAIWCKTGVHKSIQVDKVIKNLVKSPIITALKKIP
jgi:NC domain.